MSQAENNKLIAEFMGVVFHDDENQYYDNNGLYIGEELHYHTSWDWLMPVVEKIESLDYDFQIGGGIGVARIVDVSLNRTEVMREIEVSYPTKLEATYNAVVEFIKELDKEEERDTYWYEVAVSYTNDEGTETIERKPSLNEAIDYAQKCELLHDDGVDFVFVDKWFCDSKGEVVKDDKFKSLIINNK